MNLSDAIIGNRGYFAVGSVLAVYFAVFGLIDAKSTQEETRASVERSLFITLVSSGNAASFVAAMRDFGPTQIMPVTEHPSWFKFWEWGRTYQPNREPMLDWALARLGGCDIKIKDCSFRDNTRLDLRAANLRAADLHAPNPLLDSMAYEDSEAIRADLHEADLTRANLIGANVVGADLSRADLHDANLRRANLQDANLSGANLSSATLIDTNLMGADLHDAVISSTYLYLADVGGANLSGANLSGAHLSGVKGLSQTQLDGACGDENTDLDPPLTIKPCPPLKN